jgi:hypothetical protein
MKKVLVGTALSLFALAPAMGWADCDYHDKASMASSTPAKKKTEVAQASATGKATAPVAVKTSAARKVNTVDRKAPASPKAEESTVVAKTN